MPQVTALMLGGNSASADLDVQPDVCPRCHAFLQPKLHLCLAKDPPRRGVALVFQCTRAACQEPFIGYYDFAGTQLNQVDRYRLATCAPLNPEPVEVSPEVASVSHDFGEIYNQAVAGEAHGLFQLTGIGLRKALEFLIKDFAVTQTPTATEEIRNTRLGPCIEKFVSDANVKDCAKRAAWLGNDETHYVRRWTDKDVSDLKALIRLTMIWIESVLVTEKYKKEMTSGGP